MVVTVSKVGTKFEVFTCSKERMASQVLQGHSLPELMCMPL